MTRTEKWLVCLLCAAAAVPSFGQTCEQLHTCEKKRVEPERRPEPEPERRRSEPENRPERQNAAPENRSYNNSQPDRSNPASRPNTNESRSGITPAMGHARTYNTRPDGVRINPEYFATHYGYAHGFHFGICGGPGVVDCNFRVFGGEWYFNWNGGWFGIMGQMPGNWGLQTDYLYIAAGDDGNYYLYDAQFPGVAIQLTFVQDVGDDQAGAGQAQYSQSNPRSMAGSSWDLFTGKKQRPGGVFTFESDGSCASSDTCSWRTAGAGDVVTVVQMQTDKSKDCRTDWSLILSPDGNTLTGSFSWSGKTSFFGPDCNGGEQVVMHRRQ